MKLYYFIVSILIITTSLNAKYIDEEEVNYLFNLSLEDLMQIKVTGSTLTPSELKTVPSSVTVFTHNEIKYAGLDTLDELMNIVPGFQSYRASHSNQHYPFSSRGRRIGTSSSEVLILVDGQRLEEPRNSGIASVVPKYPLANIERVEFIRGPGAAIYGSNAMMGVVNIITRSNVNEISLSYGSFNRKNINLLASHKIDDLQIDFFAHLESDNGDNYLVKNNYSANKIPTDDPREFTDLSLKLKWKNTQLKIQHNKYKSENFYVVNNISNGFNFNNADVSLITLNQDFHWYNVVSSLSLNYNTSNVNFASQLTPPNFLASKSNPSSSDPLFVSPSFDNYKQYYAQFHNSINLKEYGSLQFGIEARIIDLPTAMVANNFDLGEFANKNFPITYYGTLKQTTTVLNEVKRDVFGIYAQYQHTVFDNMHITLGMRYDSFSSIDSQLSPRIAIIHELDNHNSIKLLYGKAFRAPAEYELGMQNNPVILGNVNLNPETVETYEIIWVGQWKHTGLSFGYFENKFDNSIIRQDAGNNKLKYDNLEQKPTKGFEFELSHELNDNLLLRSTYTYITEKPDLSFREADKLASFVINFQEGKYNANLIATYNSERELATVDANAQHIKLEDNWQLFTKLSYQYNRNWDGFFQIKNLLDKDFFTPASNANLKNGTPNRGREILIGFTFGF